MDAMRGSRRFLVVAVLASGCSGGIFGSNVDGKVDGEVPELKAKWSMSPTECYSGQRVSFFGVDLYQNDDDDSMVRLVSDPIDGMFVIANVPRTRQAVILSANDGCETFDVDFVRTNTSVNDIYNIEGFAVIDCELPGRSLHVDVNFAGCH